MIKISFICEKCQKEIFVSEYDKITDATTTIITVDFLNKLIVASCPECGHQNEMNLGNIEEALKHKVRLPRSKSTNF